MSNYKRLLKVDLPAAQSASLWGARKTGKSTYLREHFPDSAWFDLLDSDLFLGYSKRPALFREHVMALNASQLSQPIVVDEIQKVPLLFDEIHHLIEGKKLRFILCGSSARKLKRGQANLLGGRAWRYDFHPLAFPEVDNFDLLKALDHGLIPSHYLSTDPKRSLRAYVSDYLKEEIRDEGLTRNLPAFSRFLDTLGYCEGELLNYSNIARDCGVDAKTVKEYFHILVDTHIGFFLEPYTQSKSRQVITATPKFYLFDVGVANQLAHRSITELKGSEAGRAFENFIHMELVAYRSYKNLDYTLNYWRTKTKLEVDFVITLNKKIYALETKIGSRIDKTELKGLIALGEEQQLNKAIVVCQEPRARSIEISKDFNILVLPWKEFLLALWGDRFFD